MSENFLTHLILDRFLSSKNLQLNPIHSAVTSNLSLALFFNQCLIDIFSSVPRLINMSLAPGSVLINSKLLLSHQCFKNSGFDTTCLDSYRSISKLLFSQGFFKEWFANLFLSFSPLLYDVKSDLGSQCLCSSWHISLLLSRVGIILIFFDLCIIS